MRGVGLMGYLQCEKCGGLYKLNEGESPDDFLQCSCGGSLFYTENIEGLKKSENDQGKPEDNPGNTNNPGPSEDYTKKTSKKAANDTRSSVTNLNDSKKSNEIKKSANKMKKQESKQLSNIGIVIMFAGLICMIFAFFYPFLFLGSVVDNPENVASLFMQTIGIYLISVILMIIGVIIFLIANIGKSSTKKHAKSRVQRETLMELPGNYTIFQNVRIPKTRSLIGLLIIGPHGIFIIQNRVLKGDFIVRDEEWWRLKGNQRTKPVSNPAKLVKMNVIHLKKFLNSHNVNVEYMWMTPVVSFPPDQFTVEEAPKNYNIVPPEDIPKFILNQERTMEPELMMRAIALIAPYSN